MQASSTDKYQFDHCPRRRSKFGAVWASAANQLRDSALTFSIDIDNRLGSQAHALRCQVPGPGGVS